MYPKSGREREALEIVRYKKAALVGRLLLGELDAPLDAITVEDFIRRPRKELISERDDLRTYLRGEISNFCRRNFENVEPEDLAKLYDVVFEHRSEWFTPLIEFEREFGRLKPGVLKRAPPHATIHISPWGLQTEYPEHHLVRDLSTFLGEAIEIEERRLTPYRTKSWKEQKVQNIRPEIAALIRRRNANLRSCILACFNLVEAYINGLAWDFVQRHDISALNTKKKNVLTESEGFVSIIDKLIKIPPLISGHDPGPLHQTRDPLKLFIEVVKPHRDAIVHASPFAAPQKFGGYDKLRKLYDLNLCTVREAVDVTVSIVKDIHQFVGGPGELPAWFPSRNSDGTFIL